MDPAELTRLSRREGVRRDLVRLITRHSPIFDDVDGVPTGYVRCNWIECVWMTAPTGGEEEQDPYWWHERHAEHLAEVLTAAAAV